MDLFNYTQNQKINMADSLYEIMRLRRSIRQFSRQKVNKDLILKAIQTAGTAPSGANKQPWFFALIESLEMKTQIREQAEEVEKKFYLSKENKAWVKDLAPFNTCWQKPYLTDAPYLIAIFCKTKEENDDFNYETCKTYYPVESTGIAVGILLTSLHLSGLSTLTHTPKPMNFLRSILNLDLNYRPFMIIAVGYFDPDKLSLPNIKKKELSEITKIY